MAVRLAAAVAFLASASLHPLVGQQRSSTPDTLATERVAGELGRRLDSLVTAYEARGYSGTVLIVRRGQVVLLKGYGFADLERGVRNGPATRFELNSMTKMFTGVAALRLAAAGRLQLDAPISRYLGPFPPSKAGATVEQLAHHTAGLAAAGSPLSGESRDAFVAAMKAAPREAAPGTQYRYSNAGYSLLAAIIEVTSGQPFETYLLESVLRPAGLQSAVFRNTVPADDTLFARGYVGSATGPVRGPPNPYQWGTVGAGGVWGTVGDVYRWVVAVERGNLLPPPYRGLLDSPPAAPSLEAYGWHVSPAIDTSRARIDKGGGSADFASQLLHFPRDSATIVWTSNNLQRRWRRTLNRGLTEMIFAGTTGAPLPR